MIVNASPSADQVTSFPDDPATFAADKREPAMHRIGRSLLDSGFR